MELGPGNVATVATMERVEGDENDLQKRWWGWREEEKDVKKEAAKAISKTKKATDSDIPKKKIWTTSEISRLKPHQFEKFEKEIDLARLEGRIELR